MTETKSYIGKLTIVSTVEWSLAGDGFTVDLYGLIRKKLAFANGKRAAFTYADVITFRFYEDTEEDVKTNQKYDDQSGWVGVSVGASIGGVNAWEITQNAVMSIRPQMIVTAEFGPNGFSIRSENPPASG